ncbi:hypothetical protein EYF80_065150 [Liparis tanakae]|uniref:Uncharacterized protein n=1 Tax=Liparis tanakae TaxID=230148 RepID=A0A4Z2E7I2_9TELE|nr:hypothetical protein EYF80_065150 [Liparis tanakae]
MRRVAVERKHPLSVGSSVDGSSHGGSQNIFWAPPPPRRAQGRLPSSRHATRAARHATTPAENDRRYDPPRPSGGEASSSAER